MTMKPSRRQAVAIGVGTLAAATLSLAPRVAGAANDADDLIRQFVGEREVKPGRILIDLPEIAENGNTISLAVKVDSPMTEASYVKEVLIVADGNPRGGVARLRFTAFSGTSEVNMRIRAAESQNLIVVAQMSDGSFYKASKHIKVTIGGCGG